MKRIDARRVKRHRTYTVHDIVQLLGVHKNTVRSWVKAGLVVLDCRRPLLVVGGDLKEFLDRRSHHCKRPCGIGQLYCPRCRVPRPPAGNLVKYEPISPALGNLRGQCGECGCALNRIVSLAKIGTVTAGLEVTFRRVQRRIADVTSPSLDCDFGPSTEWKPKALSAKRHSGSGHSRSKHKQARAERGMKSAQLLLEFGQSRT
jgi:hypothetical protein